jgi:response regulator of citrate/malate metabolism
MATGSAAAVPASFGAFQFFIKPVDFDRLKAQMRQLPTAAE